MNRAAEDTESLLRPWTGRAILHLDLDAFFAAVEQLDHPEWRGKPVIVGGSPEGRGVVSTASYEARAAGVRSAMPSASAARLCPDAIWVAPRFERYQELAEAIFAIYRDETPHVQPLSIDEAFLDITPGRRSADHPVQVARRIRSRVAETGLTVSAGLATSKSVAKIASDHEKPDGLTIIWPGDERTFLAPLSVTSMSGIGPRTGERLRSLGVHAIGDLARLDDLTALTILGSRGPSLIERARGIDERPVAGNDPSKSVSNERTFAVDVRTPSEVDAALTALAAKVGVRMRAKRLSGRVVTVKLRFSDFTTRTVRRTLDHATDDEYEFGPVARSLIREAWSPGVGLRLLGIGISGFDERTEQLELIERAAVEPSTRRALVTGIDAVRKRFGGDAVRFGAEMLEGGTARKRRPRKKNRSDSGNV